MAAIPFSQLPVVSRLATALTFFIAWILFAELVIDRHGLDRFLPFYRVGNLCPYELTVLSIIVLMWVRLHRS